MTPSANFFDPASYPFRRIRLRSDLEREDVISLQADLKRDMRFGERTGYWKVGAKFVSRDKADDRENEDYNPASGNFTLAEADLAGPEPQGFMEGRYRFGPTINLPVMHRFFETNPDRFEFNELSSIENSNVSDFEAEEDVLATYAMASIDLTSSWTLLGGVRAELTDATYAGNELVYDDGDFTGTVNRVTGNDEYTTVMPGLHLTWRPNDKFVARFAWTNTLGRANYASLAPIRELDQIEDVPGSGIWIGSISEGNPLLEPYESMNLDVSLEYYLQAGGIVSVGVFHKDIDNPVYGSSFIESDITFDGRFYETLSF
ncbi:MAG: TonB-dependent receptor domain-containing protein, partial [Opitutaceae bacterium]